MRRIKGFHCHECCPKDWQNVQDLTGSFELDAVIMRSRNKDMIDRLQNHITTQSAAYGPITAYNGYRNYSGDS